MQNISIILATLTTFTTRGQTENEKMGSDMSISSEVPGYGYGLFTAARLSCSSALIVRICDFLIGTHSTHTSALSAMLIEEIYSHYELLQINNNVETHNLSLQ